MTTVTAQAYLDRGYAANSANGTTFVREDGSFALKTGTMVIDEWGQFGLIYKVSISAMAVPDISAAKVAPTVDVGKPAMNLTVPDTALAKVAPQVGVGITQTVVPDISHAAAKPSIDVGVSPVSPNILAQTLQVLIGSIITPSLLNVSANIILPSVTASSGYSWVESLTPDISATILYPTIGFGSAQTRLVQNN